MAESSYIICPKCSKANLNRDYCEHCGAIINVYLKRKLERKKREAERNNEKNRVTLFFENAKTHENPMVRNLAKFFYSIWVIVIAVGSFLAFLVGYVAA